jgi:hypothetical protein
MKDYRTHLETLRQQAAESALISALTTVPHKRELFAKHAEHLNALAGEVEREMSRSERAGTVCELTIARPAAHFRLRAMNATVGASRPNYHLDARQNLNNKPYLIKQFDQTKDRKENEIKGNRDGGSYAHGVQLAE